MRRVVTTVLSVAALLMATAACGSDEGGGGSLPAGSPSANPTPGNAPPASAEIKIRDKDGLCGILRDNLTADMVGESVDAMASDSAAFVSGQPSECNLRPETGINGGVSRAGWGVASMFYNEDAPNDILSNAKGWSGDCGLYDGDRRVEGDVVEFKVNGAPAALILCTGENPEHPGDRTGVWIAAYTRDADGNQLGVFIGNRGVGSLPDTTKAEQWVTKLFAAAM